MAERADPPVGRVFLEHERAARLADEAAAVVDGEVLRSAFAISDQHVLTAWHCVRDAGTQPLWFRLWCPSDHLDEQNTLDGQPERDVVVWLPVEVAAHDVPFDAAVLQVDPLRLAAAGVSLERARSVLAWARHRLAVDLSVGDRVQVKGYPSTSPAAWHNTDIGHVVDLRLPVDNVDGVAVPGVKLHLDAAAAIEPVDPRGFSGGPVLAPGTAGSARGDGPGGGGCPAVVAVVRQVPVGPRPLLDRGRNPVSALGAGLVATSIQDLASRLPQVADALLADVPVVANPRRAAAGAPGGSLTSLLRADVEAVDFFGRDDERDRLHAWCASDPDRSAWLVTGPGGQGKTRLALQLRRELVRSGGWVSMLVRGGSDVALVQDVCARAAAAGRSLLLVVDYAAEYGAASLADLIDLLTGPGPAVPRWRLLLLARNTGDWWDTSTGAGPVSGAGSTGVRAQLMARSVVVPAGELALASLIETPGDRVAAFTQIMNQLRPAVEGFAAGHDLSVTRDPVPPDLAGADFGSALMLHVAAVIALLPPTGSPAQPGIPVSAADMIGQILDLERTHHWLYADADRAVLYDTTRAAFGDLLNVPRRAAAVVETAVAAATLAGAPNQMAAADLMVAVLGVDRSRAADIAAWLHDLYPPPEGGTGGWLPPLQPDRFGEELVARAVRRERAEGHPDDKVLTHRSIARPGGHPAATDTQICQALTVLVRIAARDPHWAEHLTGTAGHEGLLSTIPAEINLTAVEGTLPRSNTHLLTVAAAITAHAMHCHDVTHPGWRDHDHADPHAQAVAGEGTRLLSNLAVRLGETGSHHDALAPAEEAVTINRRLVEAAPAAYLPALAMSLNDLGIRYSEVGRREDALPPTEEAVTLNRRLAEATPAAYLPDLAGSLNNLGIRYSEVGRREDALPPAEEAVTLNRRLAEATPAAYLPALATSLNNLGHFYSEVGRREDALAPAEEAVTIYRRLAEATPAAYLPDLAGSLNNLGARYSGVGRREDALAPAEEATGIYRRLAEATPAAYLPALAGSLNNLGLFYSGVGRREDALAPAEEAVTIYRRLAEATPAAYLPALAGSLNNLGLFYSGVGRREDAVAPAEEATGIYRRLAEAAPAAYLPDLAASLINLGARYSEVGRHEDALAPAEEATGIYRRLADAAPAAYLPDLAASLNNLGVCYSEVGRHEDALAPAEEATGIRRRLADAAPAAYLPALAMSLNTLGVCYSEVGRHEDALAPAEEATGIYRRLADAAPAAYLPDLAMSLNNLGIRYSEVGRREDALAPAEEATGIYRRLADAAPAAYLPALAMSLNTLGIRYSEVGRREDALAPAEEATGIYRRLADAAPAAYLPDLAMSLNNLGIRYSEVGRREDALAPAEEATGIYRRLADAAPAAYLPDLAMSLNNLGIRYSEVGRREDALAPAEEATGIYRRLAEAAPAAYLPDLAMSLNNLGIRYSEAGRREDALAPAEEATGIYRRLAEAAPAAYLPDLAMSLNTLGIRYSEAGRREDALAPAEEATGIYRRLADAAPAAYLPALAASLNTLGIRYSEAGRREDALAPAEEATGIYRRLAEAAPAAHLPALAASLNTLGIRYSEAGRREDALAPAEEATGIYRRLAEAAPAAHLPALATSLGAVGWICEANAAHLPRPVLQRGLAAATEAERLFAGVAEREPAAFSGRHAAVADIRVKLSTALGGTGDSGPERSR